MSVWMALCIIFAFGALGGIVNALFSDNGFILPRTENPDGRRILRPGFIGNIGVGGVAACVSWGLYGPFSSMTVFGAGDGYSIGLTLASLVGAVMVGIAGARWLTNEVDKHMLRAAAETAMAASHPELVKKIFHLSPAAALRMVRDGFGAPAIQTKKQKKVR